MKPPCPIWFDDTSGLGVWVNGGLVEITLADFVRLTPDEAAELTVSFTRAVEEARGWAARWDGKAQSYREVSA